MSRAVREADQMRLQDLARVNVRSREQRRAELELGRGAGGGARSEEEGAAGAVPRRSGRRRRPRAENEEDGMFAGAANGEAMEDEDPADEEPTYLAVPLHRNLAGREPDDPFGARPRKPPFCYACQMPAGSQVGVELRLMLIDGLGGSLRRLAAGVQKYYNDHIRSKMSARDKRKTMWTRKMILTHLFEHINSPAARATMGLHDMQRLVDTMKQRLLLKADASAPRVVEQMDVRVARLLMPNLRQLPHMATLATNLREQEVEALQVQLRGIAQRSRTRVGGLRSGQQDEALLTAVSALRPSKRRRVVEESDDEDEDGA